MICTALNITPSNDQLFQLFKAAVLYQAFHLGNGNVVELQQA